MFDNLPIRHKLLVLLGLSLGAGLLVSALVALYTTFAAERQSSLRELHQVAAITSENMRAALAFHDAQSTAKILQPLHTNPHIQYAAVQDDSGRLLGEYWAPAANRSEATRWLATLREQHAANEGVLQRMKRGHHYVIHPIDFEGKQIGSLTLLADNEAMYDKMRQYVVLQMGATVLIFFSLLLLSWRLQLIFTRPILELIASMQRIANSKDYTTVLATHGTDEFSELYRGFNAMLQEIRIRDERLNQLATTDTLTGLANRRHVLEAMQLMAERTQRNQTPMGVILLDVDHFKRINDGHGHAVGDLVLQEIARIVQAHIRAYDIAARFGGEEFLVLCDGADLPTTADVAERIRASVADHVFGPGDGRTLHVTVSLGVQASTIAPDATLQSIEKADRALYHAKQAGRNRIETAGDD